MARQWNDTHTAHTLVFSAFSDPHDLSRAHYKHTTFYCFIFFHELISKVQPQEETVKRLRKTKFIRLECPRHRSAMEGHREARRQEAGPRKRKI